MVWSHWKGALAVTLAWAGLAYGQQMSAPPAGAPGPERTVTIQEMGRGSVKCRVLHSWPQPDGSEALQVQALDTGEMMTIVEGKGGALPAGAPIGASAVASQQVYFWGRNGKTSPPGAPLPPVPAPGSTHVAAAPPGALPYAHNTKTSPASSAVQPAAHTVPASPYAAVGQPKTVVTPPTGPASPYAQVAQPAPSGTQVPVVTTTTPTPNTPKLTPVPMTGAPMNQPGVFRPGDVRTVQEMGRPAMKCKVLRSWVTPEGLQACELECQDNGEKMTIVESGPVTVVEGAPQGKLRAMATRIFHWGRHNNPPAGAPLPPVVVAKGQMGMPSNVVAQGAPFCPDCPPGEIVMAPAKQPLGARIGERIQSMFPPKQDAPQAAKLPPLPPPLPPVKYEPVQIARVEKVPADTKVNGVHLPGKPLAEPESTLKMDDPLKRPAASAPKSVENKLGPLVKEGPGKVPLGSQSVIDAYNGLNSQIKYLPVPMVTVPQPHRPPVPPVPEMPQAPQSNTHVNAFTPPSAFNPDGSLKQQQMPQQAMMPPSPPMMTPFGMPPGYAPTQPMHPAYAANNGMPPMQPYAGQPAPGPWPRGYQGPQPPNPFQQAPRAMTPPMPVPPGAAPYYNAAMDRQPTGQMSATQSASNDAMEQMVHVLKTSLYPSQREWAANNLSMFDWRADARALDALVSAARQDPAPTVRASCAFNLARMKATGEPVVVTLQLLKTDADPRVRQEAEQALAKLAPAATGTPPAQVATQPAAPTTPAAPTVQPAQATQTPAVQTPQAPVLPHATPTLPTLPGDLPPVPTGLSPTPPAVTLPPLPPTLP